MPTSSGAVFALTLAMLAGCGSSTPPVECPEPRVETEDVEDALTHIESVADGALIVRVGDARLRLPHGMLDRVVDNQDVLNGSVLDGEPVVATGYDATFFSTSQGISVRTSAGVEEWAQLSGVQALLLDGGTLVIGHSEGLSFASLATRELSPPHPIGSVRSIGLDPRGYYLVVVEGRPLLEVTPAGDVRELETPALRAEDAVAYVPGFRVLMVAPDQPARVHDYLALTGQSEETYAARNAPGAMRPFRLHGYELTGAEYWPYRGEQAPEYPDDILWGFHPREGTVFEGAAAPATPSPAATACARAAYASLAGFLNPPPADLAENVRHGAAPRFYLWVNDYSTAADPFPEDLREARLWYWERNPAVVGRVPGYWKWEATVTQDGECHTPDHDAAREFLRERASRLQSN